MKDGDSFYFLGELIKQISGSVSDNGELISVSVVLSYDSSILDKLISKFGLWHTGSLGQTELATGSLDISKLSYYVWRYDNSTLDVVITRHQALSNDIVTGNDLIIISHKKITSK